MADDLHDFLKTVKDGLLCYSVSLEYGQQEVGLDDTGASDEERQIRVVAYPAGFLGAFVIAFQGTLAELLALDLFAEPTMVSNPPGAEILRGPYDLKPGAFCWGSGVSLDDWVAKLGRRMEHWASSNG